MRAKEYFFGKMSEFNEDDVCIVVEDGLKCHIYFKSGEKKIFFSSDVAQLLKMYPCVYSYALLRRAYVNPKEMADFTTKAVYVNIEFKNGKVLRELSGVDFNKNVLPKYNELNNDKSV